MTNRRRRNGRQRLGARLVLGAAGLSAWSLALILGLIVLDVLWHGVPQLSLEFLTSPPRNGMLGGGVFPAIFGNIAVVLVMMAAALPVGFAAAIHLNEYASPAAWTTRLARMAVGSLAGVPSVVFGLFGLGFFIQLVGHGMDVTLGNASPIWGRPGLLWAGLTLALLTLPTVIVSAEEALRGVPESVREGSLALGATQLQTVGRVVLPQAAPGLFTGAILALSRGAGEVAPILFTGAAYFLPRLPAHPTDQFMHLGYHAYVMATQSPNVEAARPVLYGTVLVLLCMTFFMNLAAVFLRARMGVPQGERCERRAAIGRRVAERKPGTAGQQGGGSR